jgi:hypothetical protein
LIPTIVRLARRCFRMVEQLARSGVDRAEVVRALVAADRALAVSTETPTIAWAGYRAVSQLVALADEAVLICGDPEPINLSAFGFEPIVFDARDPAVAIRPRCQRRSGSPAFERQNLLRPVPIRLSPSQTRPCSQAVDPWSRVLNGGHGQLGTIGPEHFLGARLS